MSGNDWIGHVVNHHPSNTLYGGGVDDFLVAMDLVIAECAAEMAWETGDTKIDEQTSREFNAFKSAALAARDMWRAQFGDISSTDIEEEEIERFVATLREQNGKYFDEIADALEAGDYTGLAI